MDGELQALPLLEDVEFQQQFSISSQHSYTRAKLRRVDNASTSRRLHNGHTKGQCLHTNERSLHIRWIDKAHKHVRSSPLIRWLVFRACPQTPLRVWGAQGCGGSGVQTGSYLINPSAAAIGQRARPPGHLIAHALIGRAAGAQIKLAISANETPILSVPIWADPYVKLSSNALN